MQCDKGERPPPAAAAAAAAGCAGKTLMSAARTATPATACLSRNTLERSLTPRSPPLFAARHSPLLRRSLCSHRDPSGSHSMAMQRAAQRASEVLGCAAYRLQQLRGAKAVTTKLTVEMLKVGCSNRSACSPRRPVPPPPPPPLPCSVAI